MRRGTTEGGANGARSEVRFDLERDLICTSDAGGRFTSLNRTWEDVLGWSRQELLGKPLLDFIHPDDVERTARVAARVAEDDYQVAGFVNRYRHRDGGYRWLSWTARADGEQFVAIAFDVTGPKNEEQRLRQALDGEHLLAYWQPIIDVATQQIERGELLVRMRENGEVLAPAAFLPAAEEHGLVEIVDRWMLGLAAENSNRNGILHVNLSGRTLDDDDAVAELERIVADAPAPGRLVLELTESAAIEHLDAAQEFCERLVPRGCHFALDDFGTGYGSLTYLRSLPVAMVKIDRSFIDGIATSAEDQRLVRSVVALARELGISTVAEGVEDEATYEAVRRHGIDYVQGYLIGRPQPAAL